MNAGRNQLNGAIRGTIGWTLALVVGAVQAAAAEPTFEIGIEGAAITVCSNDADCDNGEICSILDGDVVTMPGRPDLVIPAIGVCKQRRAAAESVSTPTFAFTATPTWTPGPPCHGDCDGDGFVVVSELVRVVKIAGGEAELESCAGMADYTSLGIDDLVLSVNMSLHGCA